MEEGEQEAVTDVMLDAGGVIPPPPLPPPPQPDNPIATSRRPESRRLGIRLAWY
jgi:hypothetical protein